VGGDGRLVRGSAHPAARRLLDTDRPTHNEADLAIRKLEHGDVVDVETALASGIPLRLLGLTAIAYDIAPGSVAAYYPEANALVPLSYHDTQSGTPSYKSVPVRIFSSSRRAAPSA
jgi:anaerobic selenocysteine-containing dehydrogenase